MLTLISVLQLEVCFLCTVCPVCLVGAIEDASSPCLYLPPPPLYFLAAADPAQAAKCPNKSPHDPEVEEYEGTEGEDNEDPGPEDGSEM